MPAAWHSTDLGLVLLEGKDLLEQTGQLGLAEDATRLYVAQQVLDQAKVAFDAGNTPVPMGERSEPADETVTQGTQEEAPQEDDQSNDFRAIDKDKWEEILQQLDADDFKYKM
jgi:hypothetical protein